MTDEVVGPTCAVCGKKVPNGAPDLYAEVTGWAQARRKGGGTHAIRAKQYTGRYAHAACIDRAARFGPGQSELFS